MGTAYETDVIAWAQEQAKLLRSGQFADLDIEHIADEIEDVGKRAQRELAKQMVALLAHILKWQFQPDHRGARGEKAIKAQRKEIEYSLKEAPSLRASLLDPDWWADVWGDAVVEVMKDGGMSNIDLPETCPWRAAKVLDHGFFP